MTSNEYVANNNNYEDLLYGSDEFIDDVAIQSKVIADNYVKVFVIFSENIEYNPVKFSNIADNIARIIGDLKKDLII